MQCGTAKNTGKQHDLLGVTEQVHDRAKKSVHDKGHGPLDGTVRFI